MQSPHYVGTTIQSWLTLPPKMHVYMRSSHFELAVQTPTRTTHPSAESHRMLHVEAKKVAKLTPAHTCSTGLSGSRGITMWEVIKAYLRYS